MMYILLLCLILTVMSYFSLTSGSFYREFTLMIHDFKTPHYYLGIVSEDMGCEEQKVSCLTIGLVFIAFRWTTYKHNEATVEEYPWLDDERLYPSWQKLLYKFMYSLDIPIPGNNKDA